MIHFLSLSAFSGMRQMLVPSKRHIMSEWVHLCNTKCCVLFNEIKIISWLDTEAQSLHILARVTLKTKVLSYNVVSINWSKKVALKWFQQVRVMSCGSCRTSWTLFSLKKNQNQHFDRGMRSTESHLLF